MYDIDYLLVNSCSITVRYAFLVFLSFYRLDLKRLNNWFKIVQFASGKAISWTKIRWAILSHTKWAENLPYKIKNGPKTSKLSLATLWQESLGSSRNYDEISETGLICHTMLTLRRNLKIIADISLIFLVFILPPSIYHPIPREWALSCGILKLWNFIILWSLTKVYS